MNMKAANHQSQQIIVKAQVCFNNK